MDQASIDTVCNECGGGDDGGIGGSDGGGGGSSGGGGDTGGGARALGAPPGFLDAIRAAGNR